MALTTVDLSFPPTSLDYGSFLDLRQYLEHHSPIVPPEEDLTALGVWIGEQLFGDLRTLFWPRLAGLDCPGQRADGGSGSVVAPHHSPGQKIKSGQRSYQGRKSVVLTIASHSYTITSRSNNSP